MKKLNVALCVMAVTVSGCGDSAGITREYVENTLYCPASSSKEVGAFILQCIGNANPMSDEEPEDWIEACQITAEQTLCQKTPMQVSEECMYGGTTCGKWREVSRVLLVKEAGNE